MPTTSRGAGRRLALLSAGSLGLATLATGLSLAPAQAASTGLVISEAYGGGGNSGATLTHDFIELHNPTDAPISVDGMSVQYRSSGGTGAGAVTELSGTVPAGGYSLVQQAQGSGGTESLPTPDAVGTTARSGSANTVWLSSGVDALTPPTGSVGVLPGVVDLLGVNSNTW
ncbi:lamin tail domain-containing protein [Nocardioides sp.]|uniref:lamin tail domain-containing protein n=1 Tax=Nocardioides sp. TaxID=35761 RepID=UPI0035116A2F